MDKVLRDLARLVGEALAERWIESGRGGSSLPNPTASGLQDEGSNVPKNEKSQSKAGESQAKA